MFDRPSVLRHGDRSVARVKVSSKYQIVIPQEVREHMGIQVGQVVEMFVFDNRIQLVPVKPLTQMRGFLKGMDTTIEREEDRSL